MATGPTSIDAALHTGDLLEARGGQTLAGAYHAASISAVGPITLVFNNLSSATMSWPGGNVPIERFNIVANGVNMAATRTSDAFAPVAIRFTSATTAVLTLPDGRTTNLQRHRY